MTTQETPDVAPVIEEAIAPIEEAPAPETNDTPESPQEDPLGGMSEEEFTKILEDIAKAPVEDRPNAPVNFPTETKKEEASTEEAAKPTVDMEDLAELEKIVDAQIALEQNNEQLSAKLSEIEKAKDEAIKVAEQIETAWTKLLEPLPQLENVLQGLVEGKEDAVPSHWKNENWERVTSDPILGPLVQAKLKGENLDYAGFVREMAKTRMPNTSNAGKIPVDTTTENQNDPVSMVLGGRKTLKNR